MCLELVPAGVLCLCHGTHSGRNKNLLSAHTTEIEHAQFKGDPCACASKENAPEIHLYHLVYELSQGRYRW